MDPRTVLYKEFLAERQQILCHKWIESEKAGYDIGFEHALFDWTLKYRSAWLEKRLQQMAGHESPRTTKLYDRTKDEITRVRWSSCQTGEESNSRSIAL